MNIIQFGGHKTAILSSSWFLKLLQDLGALCFREWRLFRRKHLSKQNYKIKLKESISFQIKIKIMDNSFIFFCMHHIYLIQCCVKIESLLFNPSDASL